MIAVKLSESESWIKSVTSNYCTCDLWTTLLLGGKTFPISIFFFGFEFRPHSIIPVTWNQYNTYSHTSSTYRSVEGHRWLVNRVTKTHPPSMENCHPFTTRSRLIHAKNCKAFWESSPSCIDSSLVVIKSKVRVLPMTSTRKTAMKQRGSSELIASRPVLRLICILGPFIRRKIRRVLHKTRLK